jgi:Fic family protein
MEGEIVPNEDKNRYLISSIMEEAIASSQLEGAATTREVAKEMLRTNRKPRNISERMILNNYLTIKRILEIKEKKLSPQLILEIHSIISKNTLDKKDNEGRFRLNDDVRVEDAATGEVFYFPPSYTQIEGLIEHLCEFANSDNNSRFIHPIVRGIILHFLIGYIHPFVDGNGRTARALFYWFLISKGYWLIEYLSISRIMVQSPSQYARAYLFTEYDDNDLTYFIDFNLRAMEAALKNLQDYIKRKVAEKQKMYQFIKNENFNERQADLIRTLMTDSQKALTIKEVEIKYDIVYQTARLDLLGLAEMGYLKSKNVGKKLVFYVVDDFDSKTKKLSSI